MAEVVPILAPYKVASREVKPEPTMIQVRDLCVGAGKLGIIAGPCSVESEEQIVKTAQFVRACGATGLRGGAFKPRTSPYSFQGLKERGLELLAIAREETGLAVVTEVLATEDVDLVASYADVLQVGARNMQNYRLLEAVGNTDRPILLKRGPSATVDELLLAAEYILNEGNPNVMLCERGIRTFETSRPVHSPLGDGCVPPPQDASAGRGGPEPRYGTHVPGAGPGRRCGGRRRGRAHHRSTPRPRERAERRVPIDDLRAIRGHDAKDPPHCRCGGDRNRGSYLMHVLGQQPYPSDYAVTVRSTLAAWAPASIDPVNTGSILSHLHLGFTLAVTRSLSAVG